MGSNIIRKFIKNSISKVNLEIFERALALSLANNKFQELRSVKQCVRREDLWKDGLKRVDQNNFTFFEFGVWEGYSIKYFAEQVESTNAKFYGFDSFEGLPEDWGLTPKGMFDTGGNVPSTNDKRIKFIKGLFQNTLSGFLAENFERGIDGSLIVHYDADLYSSTLYCLSQIDSLKKNYIAIFDEFPGHETRALHNYIQAYGASVEFLGSNGGIDSNWPIQVMCSISPLKL